MSEEFLFEKGNLFCGLCQKLHGSTESAILAFHSEADVFMPWWLVSISQVGRPSRLCPQRILSSNCFHDLEWLLVDSFNLRLAMNNAKLFKLCEWPQGWFRSCQTRFRDPFGVLFWNFRDWRPLFAFRASTLFVPARNAWDPGCWIFVVFV